MDAFSHICHGRMQTNHHLILYSYLPHPGSGPNDIDMHRVQQQMHAQFQHCNITLVAMRTSYHIVALIRYSDRKDIRQVMKYYRLPPSTSTLTVIEVRKIHFSGMDAAFEWMESQGDLWNLNPQSIPQTFSRRAAANAGPTYTELRDVSAHQQREIERLLAEVAELNFTNHALTTQTTHLNNNIIQSCRTRIEDQQLIHHLQARLDATELQLQQSENGQLIASQDNLIKELQQKFTFPSFGNKKEVWMHQPMKASCTMH